MRTLRRFSKSKSKSPPALLVGGTLFVVGTAALIASGVLVGSQPYGPALVVERPRTPSRTFVAIPQPAPQPLVIHADGEHADTSDNSGATDDSLTWEELGLAPKSLAEMASQFSLEPTPTSPSGSEPLAQANPAPPPEPAQTNDAAATAKPAPGETLITSTEGAQSVPPEQNVASMQSQVSTTSAMSAMPDSQAAPTSNAPTGARSSPPSVAIIQVPLRAATPADQDAFRASSTVGDSRTVPGTISIDRSSLGGANRASGLVGVPTTANTVVDTMVGANTSVEHMAGTQ